MSETTELGSDNSAGVSKANGIVGHIFGPGVLDAWLGKSYGALAARVWKVARSCG